VALPVAADASSGIDRTIPAADARAIAADAADSRSATVRLIIFS
jgi:hypothetical protein